MMAQNIDVDSCSYGSAETANNVKGLMTASPQQASTVGGSLSQQAPALFCHNGGKLSSSATGPDEMWVN